MVLILGLGYEHDSGACILKDGEILAAINEERISRIKHHWSFPLRSIKEVLRITKLNPNNFDAIAIPYGDPISRFFKTVFRGSPTTIFKNIKNAEVHNTVKDSLFKRITTFPLRSCKLKYGVEKNLRTLGFTQKVYWIDHHLSHAASTYFTSGFNKCIVITCDGSGDGLCASVRLAEDGNFKIISKTDDKFSPGWLFGAVSSAIGFRFMDGEYKTSSFAAFGNPSKAYNIAKKLITLSEDGLEFRTEANLYPLNFPINCDDERLSGVKGELKDASIDTTHIKSMFDGYKNEDIAAAVQKRFEDVITEHVSSIIKKANIDDAKITFSGGVALNVKVNMAIRNMKEVDEFFVFPAASDCGAFVGAALYVCNKMMNNKMINKRFKNVYLGTEFSNNEIEDELNKRSLYYEKVNPIDKGVERILEGNVIGWFQGRMEFGPRALGCRSVIGDPRDRKIVEKVNKILKQRDWFMPYAPSMLDEVKEEYLQDAESSPFMIMPFWATKKMLKDAPAGVHIDNSTRPQTVEKSINPLYYKLIKKFGDETGVPVLLNTSFNKHGQPIVWSPENAIWHLENKHVDELIIGDFWVRKKDKGES